MGPIYFEENIEGFYTFMILPSTCMQCRYTISFSIGFVKDKNLLPNPPPPPKKKEKKKERKKMQRLSCLSFHPPLLFSFWAKSVL
jgi:hypothetical protein